MARLIRELVPTEAEILQEVSKPWYNNMRVFRTTNTEGPQLTFSVQVVVHHEWREQPHG